MLDFTDYISTTRRQEKNTVTFLRNEKETEENLHLENFTFPFSSLFLYKGKAQNTYTEP